jgi:hypothetical protein
MNNPDAEPRSILPQITQIYTDEICANQRNLWQKKAKPRSRASRNSFD